MKHSVYIYIAAMALVTYLIRVLPFTAFRKKISSKYLKSFFYYMPYAVLGAMTIPHIIYSTGDYRSAAAGFMAAGVLALKRLPLIIVALAACCAALLVEYLLK
ncbi:MAG: AzlD domain-containing protein [Papillibacter sp.]|jgi:branched-subunit amino acid transport protein|nr:AzlD domain-containing protein [Papillibacter sp.]